MIQLDYIGAPLEKSVRFLIDSYVNEILIEETEKATENIKKRVVECLPKIEKAIYRAMSEYSKDELKVVIEMIIEEKERATIGQQRPITQLEKAQ